MGSGRTWPQDFLFFVVFLSSGEGELTSSDLIEAVVGVGEDLASSEYDWGVMISMGFSVPDDGGGVLCMVFGREERSEEGGEGCWWVLLKSVDMVSGPDKRDSAGDMWKVAIVKSEYESNLSSRQGH